MIQAIIVVQEMKKEWVEILVKTLKIEDRLLKEGNELAASALGFAIKEQEKVIISFNKIITHLENINKQNKMLENLIKNNLKNGEKLN